MKTITKPCWRRIANHQPRAPGKTHNACLRPRHFYRGGTKENLCLHVLASPTPDRQIAAPAPHPYRVTASPGSVADSRLRTHPEDYHGVDRLLRLRPAPVASLTFPETLHREPDHVSLPAGALPRECW